MTTAPKMEELLIDTWWFGLTARLSEAAFLNLARQRKAEGFDAIQLVAGIPPEVAPNHPNAASNVGPAWTLTKPYGAKINRDYVRLAARRVQQLNAMGLTVVIYGGWGMQIEWTGVRFMEQWWETLISALDALDVIYCVTGEVDLWTSMPNILLPDKSTDNLRGSRPVKTNSARRLAEKIAAKAFRLRMKLLNPNVDAQRKQKWGKVLQHMRRLTSRPIIVHPGGQPDTYSGALIEHAEHLAAITVQTGHSQKIRNALWQLPLKHISKRTDRFINLEPWYEGIRNDFWAEDQLFAYWCSILAGACSHAYGAHGLWNVGDGKFLSHWGKQRFAEAKALKTPALLGQSHQFWKETQGFSAEAETIIKEHEGTLVEIQRRDNAGVLTYIPRIESSDYQPNSGNEAFFKPLRGNVCPALPEAGPVVIWESNPGISS